MNSMMNNYVNGGNSNMTNQMMNQMEETRCKGPVLNWVVVNVLAVITGRGTVEV